MTMEIQILFGTGSTNVAGFNRLMGSKPFALAKDNPNYHVPNSLFRNALIIDVCRVHS
jgi:hypothetical protein